MVTQGGLHVAQHCKVDLMPALLVLLNHAIFHRTVDMRGNRIGFYATS